MVKSSRKIWEFLLILLAALTIYVVLNVNKANANSINDISEKNFFNNDNSKELKSNNVKQKITIQSRLSNVVEVANWQEFVTAWNDSTVTEIDVSSDITAPSNVTISNGLQVRTSDIVVNGNGHKYDLDAAGTNQGAVFRLGTPSSSGSANFTLTDINIEASPGTPGVIGGSAETVGVTSAANGRWNINLNNINYDSMHADGHTGTGRFATCYQDQFTISGTNTIKSYFENFICGSVIVKPNTIYTGTNETAVSLWFYYSDSAAGTTGSSKECTIGENSRITLSNPSVNNPYGPIYMHYGKVTVNDGAQLNLLGGANAINWLNNSNATGTATGYFDVKDGGTLYAASLDKNGSHPVIESQGAYPNTSTRGINIESGGQFFVSGNNANSIPLVDYTAGGSNTYVMNVTNPKNFDINDTNQNTTSGAIKLGGSNSFNVTQSNLSVWKNGSLTSGAADHSYKHLKTFNYLDNVLTSDPAQIQSDLGNDITKYSRWNGMNQEPSIYFQKWAPGSSAATDRNNTTKYEKLPADDNKVITDADKTVRARVIQGMVPDGNKPNSDGTINYVPVWANKDQFEGSIQDSSGKITAGSTDANGFITINPNYFETTTEHGGQNLSASVSDSYTDANGEQVNYQDTDTAVVRDVTPPITAKLNTSGISVLDKSISGHGAEVGAIVTYTVNGVDSGLSATVDKSGNWTLSAPTGGFKAGDKVQIFMTDTVGNKNPVGPDATNFHDATFEPAPVFAVQATSAVKPYNPGTKPEDNTDDTNNPGTGQNAVLTIDNVPNNLNFGDNELKNNSNSFKLKDGNELNQAKMPDGSDYPETSYSNGKGSPNPHVIFTQITDRNPEGSNWKLNINSTQPLISDDGKQTKITGASIAMQAPQAQVLSADKTSWLPASSDLNTTPTSSDGTNDLSLDGISSMTVAQVINGSDATRQAGTYQIVWPLSNIQLKIPQQANSSSLKDTGFTTVMDWQLVNGL